MGTTRLDHGRHGAAAARHRPIPPRSVELRTGSLADVSDTASSPPGLTTDDVAKVAKLARLDLTADELAVAADELSSMLDHFADIDALDLDGVEPMNNPTGLVNVMRDDVVGDTLDRDEVLAAAPVAEDGRFRVPPIIGLED